jgi:hypothetical protein
MSKVGFKCEEIKRLNEMLTIDTYSADEKSIEG